MDKGDLGADRALVASDQAAARLAPSGGDHGERDWHGNDPAGLEHAIWDFKRQLPGWWYSVGECQVSCDASCGPTRESDHIRLIPLDRRFDDGFHADLPQPSSMAKALDTVLSEALAAIVDTHRNGQDRETGLGS